jgi:polysaccharide export outer membrane protein
MSRFWKSFLVLTSLLTVTASGTAAQSTLGELRRQSTRAELEESAKLAEDAAAASREPKLRARYLNDAKLLRQRLKNGDFAPGDHILIQVFGDSVLSDTFTVRADRMLRLPNIPDIPLSGILDSELEGHLTKSLAVYIRDVRVGATSLVRLAVLGSVGNPGFMTVPVDQALTDLITTAGGPGGQADLSRVVVKRGSQTVVDGRGFQEALRLGKTVGDISMRDGDQIIVPDKLNRLGWTSLFQGLSAAAALVLTLRWAFQ